MKSNESDLIPQARLVLGKILENIPNLTTHWQTTSSGLKPEIATLADFTVELSRDDRVYQVAGVFKPHGFPQQLQDAIAQLLRYRFKTGQNPELIVAAPYISPEGAELCREDDVSYFDLAGNCRISMGTIYVERSGVPNPFQKNALAAPGLFGARGERVLRTLLHEPNTPWKIVPLTKQTGVSAGTVSIIRNLLIERDWAKDVQGGILLTQPQKLLREWAQVWARRKLKPPFGYFSRAPLSETEKHLASFAQDQKKMFALTGAAAAWHYAPMTRYQRTQVYWEGEPEAVAQALNLKPTDTGANVHFLRPRDQGVFDFLETIDDVPLACPVQVFLDLQRDPARGEEAAEQLWQTKIFHA